MFDTDEVSRLFDVLGNRNRRRIIELLRQKPCFVTEISERLVLSPKAVIEHLHLMEKERILASRNDTNRRKYYYITRDFTINVHMDNEDYENRDEDIPHPAVAKLKDLSKLLETREKILTDLDYIERDINASFSEFVALTKGILESEAEVNVVISLYHVPQNIEDVGDMTGISGHELASIMKRLAARGIVERTGDLYKVCELFVR